MAGTLTAFPGRCVPSAGFRGTDHFRYTVTNTATGETSQDTTINLVVNSLPTCTNGTATTRVDTPLKLTFPCSDPDDGTVPIRAEDGQHGVVDPDVGTQHREADACRRQAHGRQAHRRERRDHRGAHERSAKALKGKQRVKARLTVIATERPATGRPRGCQ